MRNQGKFRWNGYKHLIAPLLTLAFILTFAGFVLSPWTGDAMVFMGGARQADFHGGGIFYNSLTQWELKGVFCRLINYVIYRVASLFSAFPSREFEMISLSVYAVFICAASYASVMFLHGETTRLETATHTALCAMVFFTPQIMCRMQAEMTGTLFMLLAFSLYVDSLKTGRLTKVKTFLAGILVGSLFYLKSPLILLSLSVLCAAYLWDRKRGVKPDLQRYSIAAAGAVFTLAVMGAVIFATYPQEFQDIVSASVYQDTLLHELTLQRLLKASAKFAFHYVHASLGNPVLLLGTVAFVSNLARYASKKRWGNAMDCAARIALWLAPSAYVMISNCFFYYHYFVFVFPCLTEIWIFHEETRNEMKQRESDILYLEIGGGFALLLAFASRYAVALFYARPVQWVMMGIAALLIAVNAAFPLIRKRVSLIWSRMIPLLFVFFLYLAYISVFSASFLAHISLEREMYSLRMELNASNKEILYLDDGAGSYLLGGKSYLNEYYPLPLQRITEGSPESELPVYQVAFERAMKYDGEYISLYSEWFFGNEKNRSLHEKLTREYEKMGVYPVYTVSSNIFMFPQESNLRYDELYQRTMP